MVPSGGAGLAHLARGSSWGRRRGRSQQSRGDGHSPLNPPSFLRHSVTMSLFWVLNPFFTPKLDSGSTSRAVGAFSAAPGHQALSEELKHLGSDPVCAAQCRFSEALRERGADRFAVMCD